MGRDPRGPPAERAPRVTRQAGRVDHALPFDAAGYLASIEHCRERFPGLRILSGLEIGEPHRHVAATAAVLGAGPFDRILGSVHALPDGDVFAEPPGHVRRHAAADVIRRYLAEVAELVTSSDVFEVLAHIDYPLRTWPADAGPADVRAFEDEFRHALRLLADSGRTLEVNTKLPLDPAILHCWREEGGSTVTFGSDAHFPAVLAHGFAEARDMVEAHGFRPGRDPEDYWTAR
ncbi:PHP domain-containing protein [Luedemannella flava]